MTGRSTGRITVTKYTANSHVTGTKSVVDFISEGADGIRQNDWFRRTLRADNTFWTPFPTALRVPVAYESFADDDFRFLRAPGEGRENFSNFSNDGGFMRWYLVRCVRVNRFRVFLRFVIE